MDESNGCCCSEPAYSTANTAEREQQEKASSNVGWLHQIGVAIPKDEDREGRTGPVDAKVRHRGKKSTSPRVRAIDLHEKLVAQNFRCAISGRAMTPETSALDHVRPRADKGADDLDNLQWVDTEVNAAKGTMSLKRFVELCEQVSEWSRRKIND